jgi:hypothetical protein
VNDVKKTGEISEIIGGTTPEERISNALDGHTVHPMLYIRLTLAVREAEDAAREDK